MMDIFVHLFGYIHSKVDACFCVLVPLCGLEENLLDTCYEYNQVPDRVLLTL